MRLSSASDPGRAHFDPASVKLLSLLWRWRRFLVVNLMAVIIVAAGVSLAMRNIYRAEATILPPQGDSSAFSAKMMDLLAGLGPIGFAAAGMRVSTSDVLAAVLRSRRLADLVIERERLAAYYEEETEGKTRRRFKEALNISVEADGLVKIRLADQDPQKAAAVVNTIVTMLDSVNVSLATGAAAATRRFVEARLRGVEAELQAAEDSLRSFQESWGTIALEEQLEVLIKGLALLRVERMKEEMNYAILSEQLGPDSRRLGAARERIAQLDRQISAAESAGDSAVSLTAGNAPRLALLSLRKVRQVTVYDQIYQFLRQALEQAKIDEQRNLPTFTILDHAVPPDRKWRPVRTFIVVGSGAAAFVLLALLIVLSESVEERPPAPPVSYRAGWRRLVKRQPVD